MFPSQDQESQRDSDLESRLRGLILGNANPQNQTQNAGQAPPPHMAQGPPHMYDIPQQQHMSNEQLGLQQNASTIGQPPLSTRKRPNQAQRRQMDSQLSIPINPRPPEGVQAGRGPSSSGSQPYPLWGNTNYTGQPQTHQNQRYQQPQHPSPRFHMPGSPYSPRTVSSMSQFNL
jgi:terminal uridylyltransferase